MFDADKHWSTQVVARLPELCAIYRSLRETVYFNILSGHRQTLVARDVTRLSKMHTLYIIELNEKLYSKISSINCTTLIYIWTWTNTGRTRCNQVCQICIYIYIIDFSEILNIYI